MQADYTLDASGLNCPLPILKSKVQLAKMQIGEVLRVIATDPHAPLDFKVYCMRTGHELVELIESDKQYQMFVRKTGARIDDAPG